MGLINAIETIIRIIKIKRGLKENLPALKYGELAYTYDENEVYIGGKDGDNVVNKKITRNSEVAANTGAINNLTESVAENTASLNDFANSITNNYSTTEAGFILDARVGKAIMDYINSTCKLFAWKDMPEGTDLNTLTTSGKYRVLNPTNSPIAGDCMVYVECAWDGYIRQRVEGIWYSQDVATRIMNNRNWQAWFNLADILTKCGLI